MSDTTKRPYYLMFRAAVSVVTALAPYCERVAIAGSLRRHRPEVGDIEIVCIPALDLNLIGEPIAPTRLELAMDSWLMQGRLTHAEPKRWGEKYKAFCYARGSASYKVDLFIQTPETWGVNFLIRTGSADFARRMVTQKSQGGYMPDGYSVHDARVWRNGVALKTPEEEDVFALWGMDFVDPEDRS